MRLSTSPTRDDARSVAVIHAALDAGVTWLDTADVYGLGEHEVGHNERLVAGALRMWPGDRARVLIATKGGLRREGTAWVPDGRAKHLRAACDASRRALGVETIDLYQLHAPDPRTPVETSVRALAALQREGKVRRIGLCNVTVGQIEAARRVAEIAAVQVSLSALDDAPLRNGVADYCRDHGITLVAYRPLAGERRERLARDPVLARIAADRGVSPEEVALAWLMSLGDVVPIPGATTTASARSLGVSRELQLTEAERGRLDERFGARSLRVPRARRRPAAGADGDVVLVMGMPGAGKSTLARELEAGGYERLNRDERGSSLAALVRALDEGLAAGRRRWVLDNTYPSRASRNEVIECAWRHGVPVRCVHLTTELAAAQVNAVTRMIAAHGRLPMPEEVRQLGRRDTRYFGPDAQFRYERALEPPTADEGFERVEARGFVRAPAPASDTRALILEFDGVLCEGPDGGPALRPEGVHIDGARREALRRHHADGWLLFAHAWRPQVASGETTGAAVEACFDRVRELLGVPIELRCCPHPAGPPICWCRKPLPGLALEFTLAHGADPRHAIVVGRSPADRTLAQKLGAAHRDDGAFFAAR
jgi:aryl-alcohol dehydrogenase-like predicted oxidoreductase/histidinol phosphatase-like enzyme